ncbi:MAG: TonB-dependent receptor plug [Bacteroidetes bacterium]|nr:TonB-dependent receptor plug [Bacteroidota bacterium]
MQIIQPILKSKTIAFVVMLLCTAGVFAQTYNIQGHIYNKSNHQPIANATIKIKGTKSGVVSDSTGLFRFSNLANKTVSIQISCVGFHGIEALAKTDEENTFAIQEKNLNLQEVEVTAQRYNPIRETTEQPLALQSAIQTISAQQIEQTGAINVIEAMKYSTSGNYTMQGRKRKNFISLRGQSMDYAIDGVSLYNFMDAPNALSANIIEEIDVNRSSNSLLMGYSGLSGVANYKTKLFEKFTALGEVEYGSFNKMHANITLGGKVQGLYYALSVSKDKTDGPKDRNAAEDMWNVSGKLQYNLSDKWEFSIQHYFMNGMREFAQMQNSTSSAYTVSATNLAMIWKFDPLRFNITIGKVKFTPSKNATTELQLYYVDSQRDWNQRAYYTKTVNKQKVLTDSIPPYTTTKEPDYVLGGGIFQTLRLIDNNILRIALMGSKKTTPTQTNPKGTTTGTDIRAFCGTIVDEHKFENLSINGGVKLMQNYYKKYAPGSSSVYITNQWQPVTACFNIGASYNIDKDFSVNCLISDGVVNAPLNGIDRNIVGKDTTYTILKNENRFNVDLGIVKRLPTVGEITLTAFFINRKNAYEYTGILYYDNQGIQREYLNNLNIRSYGVEFLWQSPTYMGFLTSNINATHMKSYQISNGTTSAYTTQPQTIFNASVNACKYGFTLGIFGKYVSRYTSTSFITLATTSTKVYIGDYTNVDASLSYNFPKTGFSVYGRVINIGDVKYCTVSPVYPDYGRQFFIGAKIKL